MLASDGDDAAVLSSDFVLVNETFESFKDEEHKATRAAKSLERLVKGTTACFVASDQFSASIPVKSEPEIQSLAPDLPAIGSTISGLRSRSIFIMSSLSNHKLTFRM